MPEGFRSRNENYLIMELVLTVNNIGMLYNIDTYI